MDYLNEFEEEEKIQSCIDAICTNISFTMIIPIVYLVLIPYEIFNFFKTQYQS